MAWEFFLEDRNIKIECEIAGEIRFGPMYFYLKSDPIFHELNGHIYGDWFYKYESKIFLQEWNSTLLPNTNLVCIDIEEQNFFRIIKNIKSVSWRMAFEVDNLFLFDEHNNVKYPIKFNS